MKWVVPTVTLAILSAGRPDVESTVRTASSIPSVTLGVVGVLWWASTPRDGVCCWDGSMATASVFVPGPCQLFVALTF